METTTPTESTHNTTENNKNNPSPPPPSPSPTLLPIPSSSSYSTIFLLSPFLPHFSTSPFTLPTIIYVIEEEQSLREERISFRPGIHPSFNMMMSHRCYIYHTYHLPRQIEIRYACTIQCMKYNLECLCQRCNPLFFFVFKSKDLKHSQVF